MNNEPLINGRINYDYFNFTFSRLKPEEKKTVFNEIVQKCLWYQIPELLSIVSLQDKDLVIDFISTCEPSYLRRIEDFFDSRTDLTDDDFRKIFRQIKYFDRNLCIKLLKNPKIPKDSIELLLNKLKGTKYLLHGLINVLSSRTDLTDEEQMALFNKAEEDKEKAIISAKVDIKQLASSEKARYQEIYLNTIQETICKRISIKPYNSDYLAGCTNDGPIKAEYIDKIFSDLKDIGLEDVACNFLQSVILAWDDSRLDTYSQLLGNFLSSISGLTNNININHIYRSSPYNQLGALCSSKFPPRIEQGRNDYLSSESIHYEILTKYRETLDRYTKTCTESSSNKSPTKKIENSSNPIFH